MSEFLIMLTVIFPLALVAIWPSRQCRVWVGRLAVWAPIPALVLVLLATELTVELPWLLLGSRWGLDATGRVFLGFTATIWLAAGIFGRTYLQSDPTRERFELFHLLTMAGNLGVIISQDMVSFLLFYTLMSLAAYGLITHNREPDSMRAGRTYIILAVFGEVLLFWAVILTAQQTDTLYFEGLATKLAVSPFRNVIAGLLLVGFGIKLGVMPLHFWLPLAHPAAPTPASALLSGSIIKTGLLGLLRFLPFGAVVMYEWGAVCIIAGIASAFIAVLIGLTQDNPKTVLAYSSVSQMGLLSIGVGAALMAPDAWKMIAAALLLYATHHAVVKASLFLGVGVAQAEMSSRWQRTLVTTGLVMAALSLAGLPLTSGFAAKIALKYSAAATPEPWASAFAWILPLTGVMTTLLVARFLYLVWPSPQHSHRKLAPALAISWSVLTAGAVVLFFALRFREVVKPTWVSLAPQTLWAATWPIVAAGGVFLVLRVSSSFRRRLQSIQIPAGDLVVPLTLALAYCRRIWNAVAVTGMSALTYKMHHHLSNSVSAVARQILQYLSQRLENDLATGVLIGLLAIAIFTLMAL